MMSEQDSVHTGPLLGDEWVTLQEAKRWSESFKFLLQSTYGTKLFREYMKERFSEENLDFWLEVQDYRSCQPESRRGAAECIYKRYVAVQAPFEVSLGASQRKAIEDGIPTSELTLFDAADEHVYLVMLRDCYPGFLKSRHFLSLLERL